MKISTLQKITIQQLGFSLPTLARLKVENIATLADIVAREEQITCEKVTDRARVEKPVPLDSIPLNGNIRGILARAGAKTMVSELLNLDPDGQRFWGCESSRIHATVGLIDLDYTEKDGKFLSVESFASFVRSSKVLRILIELDSKGKLSKKFKIWFNRVIEGRIYNRDNRPNRKLTVKSFEV